MRETHTHAGEPDTAACVCLAQYGLHFYLQYLAKWPEYFLFSEGPGGACQGYSACLQRVRVCRVLVVTSVLRFLCPTAQLWAKRRAWARTGTVM